MSVNMHCIISRKKGKIRSQEAYIDLILSRKLIRLFERARKAGVPFDLTIDQLRIFESKKFCEYNLARGIQVELTSEANRLNTRTYDRAHPEKGYVFENIIVCTKEINERKGNISVDELRVIDKTIKRKKMKK